MSTLSRAGGRKFSNFGKAYRYAKAGARISKWAYKKYSNRAKTARKKRTRAKVRTRVKRGTSVRRVNKKGITSHSDLKRLYNHDGLSICVGQSTKMLNTTKAIAESEEELVDHISDYATQTISNNGIDPAQMINGNYYKADGTALGAVYFGNDDLTTYNQVDYLKQVGLFKYTLTTPTGFNSPSPNDIIHTISNQIFNLRDMFKVWRKESVSFEFKWRSMINSTHPLGLPKGYYRIITGSRERVSYKADGTEYQQGEDPKLITHYENQFFSPEQTLARKYGSYTTTANAVGNINNGAFYNATASLPTGDKYKLLNNADWVPKVGQQTFCYRNIRENPKGWKKIPATSRLTIKHNYPVQFHPTQENDIALDPLILFVFESTNIWQPTQQDITLESDGGTGYTGNAVPHQDKDIIPAIICDIEILHCFKFSKRATLNKPPIVIPDPSQYHPY